MDSFERKDKMRAKLLKIKEGLSKGLVEREEVISLALLSLISGENIILIGPPGTAKSEIGRRMAQVIKDSSYYEYLLTKFSTPEEIFGPLSIKALKEDTFKRITQGYMPSANIAFLDEIFKANSAILNSLLTIINEKKYHNGKVKEDVSLVSLIGASNELPVGNEELEALYDRFLIRVFVGYVSEKNIDKLINIDTNNFKFDESLKLTLDEINHIQVEAQKVNIPDIIVDTLKKIRKEFKESFKEDKSETISDRRFVKIQKLLKISAYTNGRKKVNFSDLFLLKHMLWSNPENRENIAKIINNTVTNTIKDKK